MRFILILMFVSITILTMLPQDSFSSVTFYPFDLAGGIWMTSTDESSFLNALAYEYNTYGANPMKLSMYRLSGAADETVISYFSSADVGKTFTLTSGSIFDAVVNRLANNNSDIFSFSCFGGGSGQAENVIYYPPEDRNLGISIIPRPLEAEITSISFHLTEFFTRTDYGRTDTNLPPFISDSSYWFQAYATGTFYINQTVPEPTTMLLFGAGFVGLIAGRKILKREM